MLWNVDRKEDENSEDKNIMRFHTVTVKGLNVFYRECGSDDKPVMLLLHGFPSASHA